MLTRRMTTPLHVAPSNANSRVVVLLLRNQDVEVNVRNVQEDTAPHHASLEDHAAVVKTLQQKEGIDVNLKDGSSPTALHSVQAKVTLRSLTCC